MTPKGPAAETGPGVSEDSAAPWTRADDISLVRQVTKEAGRIALDSFNRDVRRWDKSPNNPVCDADIAVDTFLRTTLMQNRTGYGWLSEETKDDGHRLRCGRLWIVDPIDGTRAFLRGGDDWGVSVALVENGVPIIAAFYAPARGAFFFATEGQGATLNDRPLSVNACLSLKDAHMMGDPVAFKSKTTWPVPWPESMKAAAANSIALRLCLVACGEADCCVTLRPKNDWDVAAAVLIVREAGGQVTTGTSKDLVFNREHPLFDHIVAGTPGLMAGLMERVQPALACWDPKSRKP